MTTIEGIVTALVVVGSFVGITVVVLVRRADRRTPIELDPRYDDPADER
jgi:beta-lactamase regulating signal transducer with metallopeptidase domain